jgi:hypothetical protein
MCTEVMCIQKLSQRREEPVRRLLCLTEATLVERDPATYNLITLRPLSMVAALVRPKEKETKQFIFIRFRYFLYALCSCRFKKACDACFFLLLF